MPVIVLAAVLLAAPSFHATSSVGTPPIRVWLNTDSTGMYFRTGDPVRVLFRSAEDGYVLILRADASGTVQVLFPGDPSDGTLVRGATTYEVLGRGQPQSFVAEETGGSGFVLAAHSDRPFAVARFTRSDRDGGWDYGAINAARRSRASTPRAALIEIAQAMAENDAFDYDVVAYTIVNQPASPIAQAPTPYVPPASQIDSGLYPNTMAMLPYDPFFYSYEPIRSRSRRQPFVPCQWQCYPGSPNALVGFGPGRLGGSTGTGLIVGRGDPASYIALPQGPRPEIPKRRATTTIVVARRTPVVVATSKNGSSWGVSPEEARATAKIRFGPVAPLRSRSATVAASSVNAPESNRAIVQPRIPREESPVAAIVPVRGNAPVASRGTVALSQMPVARPAVPRIVERRDAAPAVDIRPRSAGQPAGRAASPSPAGGQAYVGPRGPIVPRTVPTGGTARR